MEIKGKILLAVAFLLLLTPVMVMGQSEDQDYCLGDTSCINLLDERVSDLDVSQGEKLEVTLFYSTSCPHCDKVETHIESIQSEQGEPLVVNKLKAAEESELFLEYLQNYSVPQNYWGAVPILFINGRTTNQSGEKVNATEVVMLAKKATKKMVMNFSVGGMVELTQKVNLNNGKLVTLSGIAILALADAVNPCALAVLLILLTSILTKYPKKKNKALLAGILFSLAILICYFTLGMLIVLGFKSVASISSVETGIIYKLLGALAILIGLFNIKDWFSYGAGGFVIEVPLGWRPKMKKFIHSVTSPAGAFLIGIIVSLFLLPCTSGPYFVAGGLLGSVEWSSALLWLLLYNLIFIVPMIGITLFIYGGFTSVEEISGWRERNIEKLHLVTGIILILLGIYVLSVGFGFL